MRPTDGCSSGTRRSIPGIARWPVRTRVMVRSSSSQRGHPNHDRRVVAKPRARLRSSGRIRLAPPLPRAPGSDRGRTHSAPRHAGARSGPAARAASRALLDRIAKGRQRIRVQRDLSGTGRMAARDCTTPHCNGPGCRCPSSVAHGGRALATVRLACGTQDSWNLMRARGASGVARVAIQVRINA